VVNAVENFTRRHRLEPLSATPPPTARGKILPALANSFSALALLHPADHLALVEMIALLISSAAVSGPAIARCTTDQAIGVAVRYRER
jgi:hypothetical protein